MRHEFTVEGLRLESLANQRWHWARKAEYNSDVRVKVEYAALRVGLGSAKPLERARVTITRVAPRKIRDRDNLYSAVKPVLDALKSTSHIRYRGRRIPCTRWGLIVEDDMDRVELVPAQERGEYAVRIRVEERE